MPPQRGPRPRGRRPQRATRPQRVPEHAAPVAVAETSTVVTLPKTIIVGELARALDVSVVDVMRALVGMGEMRSINETVDFETATLVANELGIETRAEEEIAPVAEEAAETVEPAGAKQVLGGRRPDQAQDAAARDHRPWSRRPWQDEPPRRDPLD